MTRTLSYSEISRALDCQAKWDFTYGGHLAGDALKPKLTAPILLGGRAWGAALGALHAAYGVEKPELDQSPGDQAIAALDASLEEDADRQREFGVHDQAQHDELRERLLKLLIHHIEISPAFAIHGVEDEIEVPLPAINGAPRASSKYRFQGFVDGFREIDGQLWLVEFKLRGRLTSVEQIALSRQIRWYAWAFEQKFGEQVSGVEVHERWNEVPRAPRVLRNGRLSRDKHQLVTETAYLSACREYEEEPHPDMLASIRERRWEQTVPIIFRDGELEEAGQELRSAAKLIHELDTARIFPLRNVKASNCNGCTFRQICANPDSELVDAVFERRPAKRDRPRREEQQDGSNIAVPY